MKVIFMYIIVGIQNLLTPACFWLTIWLKTNTWSVFYSTFKEKNRQADQTRRKEVQFGDHLGSIARFIFSGTWICRVRVAAEEGSEPVPGIVAVAARWTSIAMGLVGVLIGVLVILVGVLLLSAVLRARRHAVASFMCSLIVVIFVWCHQIAPLICGGVVSCVVALSHSLALMITWIDQRDR